MNQYYCHECALLLGKYTPLANDTLNFTSSYYQLEKFIKHTIPINDEGIVSVFDNPEYEQYKQFIVTTSASGSVEIDNFGRSNIIWFAGYDVGITYENGLFQTTTNTIKVVLHDNELKIHSFPVESFNYETKKCEHCGKIILC